MTRSAVACSPCNYVVTEYACTLGQKLTVQSAIFTCSQPTIVLSTGRSAVFGSLSNNCTSNSWEWDIAEVKLYEAYCTVNEVRLAVEMNGL